MNISLVSEIRILLHAFERNGYTSFCDIKTKAPKFRPGSNPTPCELNRHNLDIRKMFPMFQEHQWQRNQYSQFKEDLDFPVEENRAERVSTF